MIGLLLGILAAVLFHRIWPVLQRWQRRLAGWVRQSLAWMRSGVEVRFQAETVEYVQRHHLGRSWAKLDQIFVAPQLLIQQKEVDPDPSREGRIDRLAYLWPDIAAGIATPALPSITVRELLLNGRRTVVSAAAGSGKTTLLAYCAYWCATATQEGPDADLAPLIPLFIHFTELDLAPPEETTDSNGSEPFKDPMIPLRAALQKRYSPITSPGIRGMLQRKLKAGQALLLLDGWDEMAAEARQVASAWLGQLLRDFPNMRVIAAASQTGYGPLLELEFDAVGILPWKGGQVESFAARWTKALPLSQPPHQEYYWRAGQSNLENQLRFWQLTVAPSQDGRQGGLRHGRLELLSQSVQLFMDDKEDGRNDEAEDHSVEMGELTLAFWRRLAYTLVTEGELGLGQEEIAVQLAETLAERRSSERRHVAGLNKSVSQNPIFVTWSNGKVSFMCPAWRDYLAGVHIAMMKLGQTATSHLLDPHWVDVLRAYVSQAGATDLATSLLAAKERGLTFDALFQVADWMADAPDSGEWRRQTMIMLGQIIRQGTFSNALRARAIAAMVQTGEQGVSTFLTQLLERSDPFLRQLGTAALPNLGAEQAVGLLSKMLEDGDGQVRQTAVYALARLPHQVAERPLLLALIQGDDEMNRIAAEELAQGGSEGIDILKEAVEDEDLRVRRAAIYGLVLLDEEWVGPILLELERRDKEWLVKAAAAEAQETIKSRLKPPPWRPTPLSKQKWLVKYAADEGRIVPKGAAAQPFLVQILTESSWPKLRAAAAASLGLIAAQDAAPALETAARDADDMVREAAFLALCQVRRAYGPPARS